MKPPSRPATSSPDSKEEVEACIVEVNVINRVTVQRLVARVATDEIPPGGTPTAGAASSLSPPPTPPRSLCSRVEIDSRSVRRKHYSKM